MIKAYTLFNREGGVGTYFYAMETFLGIEVYYNLKNKVIADKNDTIIIGDVEALKYFDFKNYFRTILFVQYKLFDKLEDVLKNQIKEYIEENQKYSTQRLIIFNSEYTKNDFETYFNCKLKNTLILYPTPIKNYDLNLNKEKYLSIENFKKTFIDWYNSLDKKIIIYTNGGQDKVRLTPYTIQSHAFIEELKDYIKQNNLNWEVINCETQSFKNDTNLYDTLEKYWRVGDILLLEDDKVYSIEIIKSLFNDISEDVSFYTYGITKESNSLAFDLKGIYTHNFKTYLDGNTRTGCVLIRKSTQLKFDINEMSNHDYNEIDLKLSNIFKQHNIKLHLLGFINHLHYKQWNKNDTNIKNDANNIIYDGNEDNEDEDYIIYKKYEGQDIDVLFRTGQIDLKTYNKLKSLG